MGEGRNSLSQFEHLHSLISQATGICVQKMTLQPLRLSQEILLVY